MLAGSPPVPGRTGVVRGAPGSRPSRWAVLAAVLLIVTGCTPPGLPPPEAPSSSESGTSAKGADSILVVGVDGSPRGFNPHIVADSAVGAQAIASLVLPSAFDQTSAGPIRDTALVEKAVVTSTDPFQVTYTLARNAAWSDGIPITAEDFIYLTDQMQTQTGTIDPAGYRMISSIDSRDAGKTVVVNFRAPFPDWQELFDSLLPSHILKDAPGGWSGALDLRIPVSGNRYKFDDFDNITNEATLLRNDKFWGSQPGPATVIVRFGTDDALVNGLARGDVQAILVRPDSATQAVIDRTVPADRRAVVPRPAITQLLFGQGAGPTGDVTVRRAIAAALDMPALRLALSGGNGAGSLAVPTDFELPATEPFRNGATTAVPETTAGPTTGTSAVDTADPTTARQLLGEAGYTGAGVYLAKDGVPLRLRLSYPAGNTGLARAAQLIQAQLGQAGMEVDLVSSDLAALVAARFATTPDSDLALLTAPRRPSDAVNAASAFGCAVAVPTVGASASPVTAVSSIASSTGQLPAPVGNPGAGNLSRSCDQASQPSLTQALSAGQVSATLRSTLATPLPFLELAQPTMTFAVSKSLATVLLSPTAEWVWSTPLVGLPSWSDR